MKHVLLLMGVLSLLITACSKSNSNDPGNEPDKSLFENTIWSGEMTVDAHPHNEPFSLFFKPDSTVEWNNGGGGQTAGRYLADHDNKKITVTFDYYMWGPSFTADILPGNKLGNFVRPSGENFKLLSCELNTTTDQPLPGTTWTGPYGNKTLKFVFKSNQAVEVSTDNVVYRADAAYTRDAGYLRINTGADRFYGVFFGNTIKGIYVYASQEYIPYTLTKQP